MTKSTLTCFNIGVDKDERVGGACECARKARVFRSGFNVAVYLQCTAAAYLQCARLIAVVVELVQPI